MNNTLLENYKIYNLNGGYKIWLNKLPTKKLYISAVIDPFSTIGIEIINRLEYTLKSFHEQNYNKIIYNYRNGITELHITLLDIYIPVHYSSLLYNYLINYAIRDNLNKIIKKCYLLTIGKCILYSKLGEYDYFSNKYFVRKYNINSSSLNNQFKIEYTNFKKCIINILIHLCNNKIIFKKDITISKNVVYNNQTKIIRFYLINNPLNIQYYPPSLFAIPNFYDTDSLLELDNKNKTVNILHPKYNTIVSNIVYTPHISIYDKFNKNYTLLNIKNKFTKYAQNPLSYLNLWSSSTKQFINNKLYLGSIKKLNINFNNQDMSINL